MRDEGCSAPWSKSKCFLSQTISSLTKTRERSQNNTESVWVPMRLVWCYWCTVSEWNIKLRKRDRVLKNRCGFNSMRRWSKDKNINRVTVSWGFRRWSPGSKDPDWLNSCGRCSCHPQVGLSQSGWVDRSLVFYRDKREFNQEHTWKQHELLLNIA